MTDTLTLTYPGVAEKLGVTLCSRACVLESLDHHTRGYVSPAGIVHWKDRGVVRRGLYTFLKLVARRNAWDEAPSMSRAELLWFMSSQAYRLGLEVGVRFPREFADTDRAQVRAELAATGPGGRLAGIDHDTREKIDRWARE